MEPGVFKNVAGGAAVLAVGLAVAAPAGGGDHFPIAGVYARDRACKGDGSDPVVGEKRHEILVVPAGPEADIQRIEYPHTRRRHLLPGGG